MGFPFNYKQITVEQYQTIQPFLEGDKDWVKIAGFFLNKTDDEVESLPLKELKWYYKKLSFLNQPPQPKVKVKKYNETLVKSISYSPKKHNWLIHNKTLYKSANDVNGINSGDYITIKTLLAEKKEVDILHTLCAVVYKKAICKDIQSFSDKEQSFKQISVYKAYCTLFFCLEVLMNWILNTPDYLESVEILMNHLKALKTMKESSENIGDGIV
jgi:hypothetical protein